MYFKILGNGYMKTLEVIDSVLSTAWSISIITMLSQFLPPPLLILYSIWILGCSICAWASWTRRSVGMFANYLLLVAIDLVGLIRMLT
jgi:hypothetical protein